MGLSARVYVNAKQLSTVDNSVPAIIDPHTGEITLESDEQFIALQKQLGNAALIGFLSQQVTDLLVGLQNSVLATKVLYSGSHSGDVISLPDFPQLQSEISRIRMTASVLTAELQQFLDDLEELMCTAQEQDNPIVFT